MAFVLHLFIVIIISGFKIDWPILFYLLILPNLRISFRGIFNINVGSTPLMGMIGHYWSLGVEEQFYSFWPWLVKKSKRLLPILIILPLAYILIKLSLRLIHAPYGLITFFNYTRFGCMALGGLGAYLYFFHREKLVLFSHKAIEIITYLFFILIFTNNFHLTSIIDHEIVSVFTLILIYNQIANQNVLFSFENKVMDFLGKISFGLYVYHPLIIYLLSLVLVNQFKEYPNSKTLLIFIIVSICSIVVAHFSYEYFEKWFLRFKLKYITVKSAANKKEFNAN